MPTATSVTVPYAYLTEQFHPDTPLGHDILRDIAEEMRRGWYTLGPWVEKFERAVCDKWGVKHCVGVGNGTDALILALKASGVGPGDTVLTIPNTFVATVGAIIAAGATLKFVDVDQTYQMDVSQGVHRRVKCAMPVHLTGLAREHGEWPLTIHDAAQAVGAEWNGKPVAQFADIACFSLHPLKNLNVMGDGGFITTNNDDTAATLRLLRNHGLINRDTVAIPGVNSRLDSIQAIAAWHGLKEIDWINERRRVNAARYDLGLKGVAGVVIPPRPHAASQVYHTYVIQTERREALQAWLTARNVETKIHYPLPCHLQPGFKFLGYRKGDFPVCEAQAERILSLPIHQYLSEGQIDHAIESIREFYRQQPA